MAMLAEEEAKLKANGGGWFGMNKPGARLAKMATKQHK